MSGDLYVASIALVEDAVVKTLPDSCKYIYPSYPP
jgi:hypothetical protein